MAAIGGSGTTILQQIEMATLPSQQGLNTALLSKTSPLLRVLQESAKRETGSPIRAHVRYNRNKTQWYEGSAQLTATRTVALSADDSQTGTSQFAQAEYGWKNLSVNVSISEDQLVENAGLNINDLLNIDNISGIPERDRNTVFNVFAREAELMADDMSDSMATALCNFTSANAFGTSADHNATGAINSIFSLLDKGSFGGLAANALGTFTDDGLLNLWMVDNSDAGITDSTTNKWQARLGEIGHSALDAAVEDNLSKQLLGIALHDTAQGGVDAVDYIFCNPRIYVGLEMLLEGQTQRDETMSNIGFNQNMTWNAFGTTIMADPYVPVHSVIGINSKHTYLAIHPSLDSQFSGFKTHPDRAVIEGQLKLKTQLVCDDRAKNFWLYLGDAGPYKVGGDNIA